jgi:endonuclease/exonuclease/phosphatase (EEP) superfamily protein YafD
VTETQSRPPVSPSPGLLFFRRIVVLLVILVVAVAGAGTFLGFAARHSWHLELACHFRVQYFWLLFGGFLVFAFTRHKYLAIVSLALAMTNLVLIVPLYFGPAPRADTGPPLRAMSFNVHYLNRNYGATLELILKELPDFVLLLEVTPEWAKALEFLKPEYPYQHVMAYESSTGLAFYSRHEIKDLRVYESPGYGLPTIVVGLETPGGRLTFVGTHPASPRSASGFELRNSQLEQVGQLASVVRGPVILMGDLNTTSWSPFFQELLSKSKLLDSRRGFGVEPSWPWLPGALFRIPIDHCLVSESVSVLDRRIGPEVGSDHRPVFIDFAFSKP